GAVRDLRRADAPPAGREGPRLVRGREPGQRRRPLLVPADAFPSGAARRAVAGRPEAKARRVAVRVHVGRRRNGRGAGGAAGAWVRRLLAWRRSRCLMPIRSPCCGAISTPSTPAISTP